MKNIIVVDMQYGYLDEYNCDSVTKINAYLENNHFDNVFFTIYTKDFEDLDKCMFWEGFTDKNLQRVAVNKPIGSKTFEKKNYALSTFFCKYLSSKDIREVELVGINVASSIQNIQKQLTAINIDAKIIDELIFESSKVRRKDDIAYMPNILTTVNGFYYADVLCNAYKNKSQNTKFPDIKNDIKFSPTTLFNFAMIEWLGGVKKDSSDFFKILNYYYKLFPENQSSYPTAYSSWAKNGCRTYRISEDTLALKMCGVVGWYANTTQNIDNILEKSIIPVNYSEDAEQGTKMLCYTILFIRLGYSKEQIQLELQKHFELDFSKKISNQMLTTLTKNCTNTAYISILIFLQTKNFETSIKKSLSYEDFDESLALSTILLSEAYYKKIPHELIYLCRLKLPQKFKSLLMKFTSICDRN